MAWYPNATGPSGRQRYRFGHKGLEDFMLLYFREVGMCLDEGTYLPYVPRWQLRQNRIHCGPYSNAQARRAHIAKTIGCTDIGAGTGTDEFRFDPLSLLLVSLSVKAPEKNRRNMLLEENVDRWPSLSGVLILPEMDVQLTIERKTTRWLTSQGEMLYGMDTAAIEGQAEPLRLEVAQNFSLVFSQRQYCGWILKHPARYLVSDYNEPAGTDVPPELVGYLIRYLELVSSPLVFQMWDGDEQLRDALLRLRQSVRGLGGMYPQKAVLSAAIEDVLEYIYDWTITDAVDEHGQAR